MNSSLERKMLASVSHWRNVYAAAVAAAAFLGAAFLVAVFLTAAFLGASVLVLVTRPEAVFLRTVSFSTTAGAYSSLLVMFMSEYIEYS